VPGQENTAWAGGVYPVTLAFPEGYPLAPPTVLLPPGFWHPNVFDNGQICLSIISPALGWKPSISVAEVLLGVQSLLSTPNATDPANWDVNEMYVKNREEYDAGVEREVKKYTPKKH
jgi:ubiquitin-conjugating enzyme E2 I